MDNNQMITLIKNLSRKNGEAPTQIFKKIGISKSFINNLENGSKPSVESIEKIADYFGVSTDYLLGRDKGETKGSIIKSIADNGATQQIINNKEQLQPLEQEMLKEFRKLSRKEQLKEIDRLIIDED